MYSSTFSYILQTERDLENKKIPVGFRFCPTKNELLQYLHWKENGNTIANIIKEVPDLYKYNPYELHRDFNSGKDDEFYLFTTTNLHGSRTVRTAGNGRWKNIRLERIMEGNRLIGYMTVLSFEDKKKTGWNMHEYSLPPVNGKRKSKDNLVLCKIYPKRPHKKPCDESILGSSVADGEAENKSCWSSQCPTHERVTNDPEQHLFNGSSADCVETERFRKKLREIEAYLFQES